MALSYKIILAFPKICSRNPKENSERQEHMLEGKRQYSAVAEQVLLPVVQFVPEEGRQKVINKIW